MEPKIIFEDTHLVVLSKPSGLLSQGEKTGDPNLVDWCRSYFGRNYVGLVHRLDRSTSGLMVVAKRSKSAERLTRALQEGHLVRKYEALLEGHLDRSEEWEHWLLKDERTNRSRALPPKDRSRFPQAKEARLRVTPLKHWKSKKGLPLTLAEFELDTGRSHQIRVQASAMGFPLWGDEKYGATYSKRDPSLARTTPALHSFYLSFPHPMSSETLQFVEHSDFMTLLEQNP